MTEIIRSLFKDDLLPRNGRATHYKKLVTAITIRNRVTLVKQTTSNKIIVKVTDAQGEELQKHEWTRG
jgi:hypothetical protein